MGSSCEYDNEHPGPGSSKNKEFLKSVSYHYLFEKDSAPSS